MSLVSSGSTVVTETFVLGNTNISLETGKVAKQADAAVVLREKRSMILATVATEVLHHITKECYLSVEYRERMAAVGRIPGNYFRRELRPGDHEILLNRLVDRSLRPTLPFYYDRTIHIQITVFSADPQSDIASLSLLAASAALALAPIPTSHRVVGGRMVKTPEGWEILDHPERKNVQEDVFLSLTDEGLVAMEGGGEPLPMSALSSLLTAAQQLLQPALDAVNRLVAAAKREMIPWQPPVLPTALLDVTLPWVQEAWASVSSPLRRTWQDAVFHARRNAMAALCGTSDISADSLPTDAIDEDDVEADSSETSDSNASSEEKRKSKSKSAKVWEPLQVRMAFDRLLDEKIRQQTLSGIRIDGRQLRELRAMEAEVGYMPMNHGSALLTRGQTQALVSATVGRLGEGQTTETLQGQQTQHFMLHYNFPGFATGQVNRFRPPSFREHGHGYLARRAFLALLPPPRQWGKSIRVVSDITESSGSSSMATVCAATLALMDAGVPLSQHVAGVALGLMRSAEHAVILSDLSGDEDMCGDMDLKLAGTSQGLTSFQLDTKQQPLSPELFLQACEQGWQNLQEILAVLQNVIPGPRTDRSYDDEQQGNKKSGSGATSQQNRSKGPKKSDVVAEVPTVESKNQETDAASSDADQPAQTVHQADTDSPSPTKEPLLHLEYQVDVNQVGRVIGTKGRNIRALEQLLPVRVRADETGKVSISGKDGTALIKARRQIKALLLSLQKHQMYWAIVAHIEPQGILAQIGDHVGWLSLPAHPESGQDIQVGHEMLIRVEGCDEKGKLLFSAQPSAEPGQVANDVAEQSTFNA